MAEAEWSVEVTPKPVSGLGRLLRHHPNVVAAITDIAAQIAARAAAGHKEAQFGVIVQNKANTHRARALVHPTNNAGIHVELTQHVMIKAAAGAQHKVIPVGKMPSSAAQTIGSRDGDSAASVGADGTMQPVTASAALSSNKTTKPT